MPASDSEKPVVIGGSLRFAQAYGVGFPPAQLPTSLASLGGQGRGGSLPACERFRHVENGVERYRRERAPGEDQGLTAVDYWSLFKLYCDQYPIEHGRKAHAIASPQAGGKH
jgi:hypothetical protein